MTIEKLTGGPDQETLIVYADVYTHEDASAGDSDREATMFSRHGKSHGKSHNKPKNSKKHHIREWARSKKNKQEANLFTASVMMSSSESSPPPQASIITTNFDVVDDARLGKFVAAPVTKSAMKPAAAAAAAADTEAIEEAVPIMQKTLPTPEPKPALEKNGIDINAKKSPDEPDKCLIDCIYFAQQCCECTII